MLHRPLFYHAAFGVFHAAHNYKGVWVDLFNLHVQAADLEAGDNGIEDVYIPAVPMIAKAAFAFVSSYTAAKFGNDHVAYIVVVRGYNSNAGVFFDALYYEVERFGGREVGDHRIEGCFNRKKISSSREDEYVDGNDNIANCNAELAAEEDGQHFGAVDYRTAPYGKSDTCTEEETAEYGNQQVIGCYYREVAATQS